MLFFLFFISLYDIRHHRIPNIAIAILPFLQVVMSDLYFNFEMVIPILVFAFFSKYLCSLGGGDIKLIGTLLLFCLHRNTYAEFFIGLTFFTAVLMAIYAGRYRTLKVSVPLAPAISGGYLATFAN